MRGNPMEGAIDTSWLSLVIELLYSISKAAKEKIDENEAQKLEKLISFYRVHRELIARESLLQEFLISVSPDSQKFYYNKPFLYEQDWIKQPCPIDDVLDSTFSESSTEKNLKDQKNYKHVLDILKKLGTINDNPIYSLHDWSYVGGKLKLKFTYGSYEVFQVQTKRYVLDILNAFYNQNGYRIIADEIELYKRTTPQISEKIKKFKVEIRSKSNRLARYLKFPPGDGPKYRPVTLPHFKNFSLRTHLKLGVNCFLVYASQDKFKTILVKRKETLAEYPSWYHVVPAGAFQPFSPDSHEYSLRETILREFAEEILNISAAYYSFQEDNKFRGWLLDERTLPEQKNAFTTLDNMSNNDLIIEYTGLGFDLYECKPELTAIMIIKDPTYWKDHVEPVRKITKSEEFKQKNPKFMIEHEIWSDKVIDSKEVIDFPNRPNIIPAGAMAIRQGLSRFHSLLQ